ncbi:MAG: COX15/CtaA family protein [Actinobacteria bacterium]|nr:COX15/CtaA family protein [Actinomycetota bacterium]
MPAVSQRAFRRLSIATTVGVTLMVLSGEAVRLTGSGLGCSDWPTCYHHRVLAQLSFHPLVEFGNRLLIVFVTVVIGVTFLAALLRRPKRADLVWLSAGLVAGTILQALLGALVVYSKLNPYVVMLHFLASMPLVVDAVVLLHRSNRDYSRRSGTLLVPTTVRHLVNLGIVLLGFVLIAGSATTGTTPQAGGAPGQIVAKRIPVELRSMAQLHADFALFLVGFTLALVVALQALDVPERVKKAGRILVVVLAAQAVIGYTQYFTHLPALLVELHVVGATSLVIGFVHFSLSLTHHPIEPVLQGSFERDNVAASRVAASPATASSVEGPADGAKLPEMAKTTISS